jgi:hypothetical protein
MIGRVGLIATRRGAYQDMVHAWPSSDTPMGRPINRLPTVVPSDGVNTVEWKNARPNEASAARASALVGRTRAVDSAVQLDRISRGAPGRAPVTEGARRWES